ncbi:NAD(P)/FAD-dependent oxidoreductase, partial [Acinetobacter baumannii]|nr:NAD(P)/FAD-dependent oxidoreductase [Acinetobacter baumannii]MVT90688.1 NAD(P)/FAD-dependent oxidoreductase [Acinetobacter baumannii]MVT98133.1 NAD(P)/FAD-dependent oxidoreductase [Acinetobacter baumannii]MVU04839.1 NAD(P)/FAD-dependent oxidoreductase [Acinetobacter baumannii]MVU09116.1 NAD(P)/FAD-dependent oxidoreductase [Acinetobacter baumannii]
MLSTIREQWFSNIRGLCTRQISQNPYPIRILPS